MRPPPARSLPIFWAAAVLSAAAGAGARAPVSPGWGTHAHWSDGKAEIARYDASQVVDGTPREFEAVLITSREPLAPDPPAKRDGPADGAGNAAGGIQLNLVLDIPAPDFPRHFLGCVRVKADDPASLLRQTVSCQDWEASTHKEFLAEDGKTEYLWRSLREKEGNGKTTADFREGERFTEEQLFLVLRAIEFKPGMTFTADLFPPQLANRVPKLLPEPAVFSVTEGNGYKLEDQPMAPTWRILARQTGGRTLMFEIGREFPHHFVSFMASEGRSLRLKSVERRALREVPR